MTREEARQVIREEGLTGYNWNEKRAHDEDEVGIRQSGDQWEVYATSERASIVTGSETYYSTEEEALDDFIDRLRADKILRSF